MRKSVRVTASPFSLLRLPGVPRLFGASCVARLPMGAVGLLIVLDTQQATGSYARGGLAAGVYAIAAGGSSPALARLIDRRGQTLVLRAGALIAAAAITGLALLPADAPTAATLSLAAIAGGAQPPIGACMRALWPELIDDPDRRHTAYSLEGVVLEFVYICGPLVLVAGVGSFSTEAALAASAGCVLAGNLLFSMQRESRMWRAAKQQRARRFSGALESRGLRLLVLVLALTGLSVGAVEVVVPALLTPWGHRGLTGVMLAVWGIGSMAGGLAGSRVGVGARPARRLAWLTAAWGLAHAAVGLAGTPVALGALLLVAGATIAPTFVCGNSMLDGLAAEGTLTEASTWLSTALGFGIAAGTALAGVLIEAASTALAMAVCSAGALLAAAAVVATGQALLAPRRRPAAA